MLSFLSHSENDWPMFALCCRAPSYAQLWLSCFSTRHVAYLTGRGLHARVWSPVRVPHGPAPSAAPRGRFCRENADLADALVGLAAGCERHGFAWQVAPRLRARLARLALGHTAAAIPGDVDAAWLASHADVKPRDSAAAGAAAVLLLAAARSCLSQGGASLALLRALNAVCKDGLGEGATDPDPKPDLKLDAAPGGEAAQPAAPAAATAAAGSTAGAAAAIQSAAQPSCREGAAGTAQGPLAPPPPPPPKLREAVDRLGLGVGELEVLAACVGVDRKTLGLGSAAQQRAALSALLQVRCVKTLLGFLPGRQCGSDADCPAFAGSHSSPLGPHRGTCSWIGYKACVNICVQARLDAAARVPRALRARAELDTGLPGASGLSEARAVRLCLAEVLEREVRRRKRFAGPPTACVSRLGRGTELTYCHAPHIAEV